MHLDLPITTIVGHGITLRLTVLDETVKAAELVLPLTEVSRVIALGTAVTTALALLVDEDVNSIATPIQTAANDLADQYDAHRIYATAHAIWLDNTNTVGRDLTASQDDAIVFVNHVAGLVSTHSRGGRELGQPWHIVGDNKNTLIAPRATSHAGAVVLLADARERVYERHRLQVSLPSSHDAADALNDLSAPSLQDAVIVAFLDAAAAASPAVSTGQPAGATALAAGWGYKRRRF